MSLDTGHPSLLQESSLQGRQPLLPANEGGNEMSTEVIVDLVGSDGIRKAFRKGAGDDGPRPIGDEELEAVAGGGNYQVTFFDGCVMNVHNASNGDRAAEEAVDLHTSFVGHSTSGYTVAQI